MGGDTEKNGESLFFLELNDWIFRQSGARWDSPTDLEDLLNKKKYRTLLMKYLHFIARGPRAFYYLRLKGCWLLLKNPSCLWGWKDPRNTFTLPLWIEMFPDARIICIERNGIDVAKSILARKNKDTNKVLDKFDVYKWIYSARLKRDAFGGTCLIDSETGALELWRQYVVEARKHVTLHSANSIYINYEELLANPESGIRQVAKFIGSNASENEIRRIASMMDKSRANASATDDNYHELCFRYKEVLSIHNAAP